MDADKARSIAYTVRPEQAGKKGRTVLSRELGLSNGMIASLSHIPGAIMLNGAQMHMAAPVSEGDVITVRFHESRGNDAAPIAYPLEIVYEDEDIAVFNKPHGMAVHGSARGSGCTLANAAAALWGPETPFRPVHRLDRGTSGLLVAAKNAYSAYRMQQDMHTDRFIREYLAVSGGCGLPAQGFVELPIRKAADGTTRRIVSPDGAFAKTGFKVLESHPDGELLEIRPFTGRTHQIRVHMAALGHPLIGDGLYGGSTLLDRPALHSYRVRFFQPVTGREIALECPLPDDMQALLCQLRERQ